MIFCYKSDGGKLLAAGFVASQGASHLVDGLNLDPHMPTSHQV